AGRRTRLEIPRHPRGNGLVTTMALPPRMEGFPVKVNVRRRLVHCKRRIRWRLRKRPWQEQHRRLFRDRNVQGEVCGAMGSGRDGTASGSAFFGGNPCKRSSAVIASAVGVAADAPGGVPLRKIGWAMLTRGTG